MSELNPKILEFEKVAQEFVKEKLNMVKYIKKTSEEGTLTHRDLMEFMGIIRYSSHLDPDLLAESIIVEREFRDDNDA